jgi:hypothetical protein
LDKLDYISVDNYFWIRFNENFISLGTHEQKSDIHLTISYHTNDTHVNLHLSKNIETGDRKPKIEICRINKGLLDETIKVGLNTLLSNILERIDVDSFKSNDENLEYMSMDEVDESTERLFLNSFKEDEDYKIKQKRRLKIATDIETKFKQISERPEFEEMFKTKTKPLESSTNQIEAGVIMTSGTSFSAMKIGDNWYKFRDNVDVYSLLSGIVERQTIARLKWRFKKSVILIKRAKSYEDTKEYDMKKVVLEKPANNNS